MVNMVVTIAYDLSRKHCPVLKIGELVVGCRFPTIRKSEPYIIYLTNDITCTCVGGKSYIGAIELDFEVFIALYATFNVSSTAYGISSPTELSHTTTYDKTLVTTTLSCEYDQRALILDYQEYYCRFYVFDATIDDQTVTLNVGANRLLITGSKQFKKIATGNGSIHCLHNGVAGTIKRRDNKYHLRPHKERHISINQAKIPNELRYGFDIAFAVLNILTSEMVGGLTISLKMNELFINGESTVVGGIEEAMEFTKLLCRSRVKGAILFYVNRS
jgi:hypothetical protein